MNKGLVKALLKFSITLIFLVGLIALMKVDFKTIYISGVVGVITWIIIKSIWNVFKGED